MANQSITALKLTAASASTDSGDLENISSVGASIVIDITAITGTTPTATFTVQGKDPVSGKYYTILASTALNATGTTVLKIYPGLTVAANSVASDVLPRTFKVAVTIAGTTPAVTATVGVNTHG